MLQILDGDDDDQEASNRPEVHFIGLLLDYFIEEISCRNNFEFIQAMIRLFLKVRYHPFCFLIVNTIKCHRSIGLVWIVPEFITCIVGFSSKITFWSFAQIHGESVRRQPIIQEKAKKLLQIQSTVWQKIDKLFQSTRCMVTFLSNSQF